MVYFRLREGGERRLFFLGEFEVLWGGFGVFSLDFRKDDLVCGRGRWLEGSGLY